jgi:hypothetical protein
MAICVSNSAYDGWMAVQNMIATADAMLTRPTLDQMAGAYNCPAICVGSGPSVSDHIEAIRALNNKFLIFAAESAAKGLIDAGIRPHFICPQERVKSPFLSNYEKWAPPEWHPFVICTPMIHPASLSGFKGRIVPVVSWNQPWRWYWKHHSPRRPTIEGSSTGVCTVTFASILTSGPIYLVGQDCAYDDNATHWTQAQMTADLWTRDAGNGARVCGYDEVWIEKNGGGQVRSCLLWARFRGEIAARGMELHKVGRVLANTNLERGARIPYTINEHLPAADLLPDFVPIRKFTMKPDAGPLRQWVEMARHLREECKEWPFSSRVGNQEAINMITGCIDSCNGYWQYWNRAHGVVQDTRPAVKEAKIAAMHRIYPDLLRALEWTENSLIAYETFLKSQTPSDTSASPS